ncbi:MAG TPA: response regulator [Planctomycetota bacterium]|nr:response regulator [Planctomycetota bacterium]
MDSHGGERPRALVVDDARTIRRILKSILEEAGFLAVEAENGSDALAWLASGETAHLVFVDWEMPEMNGISFVRKVRESPTYRDIRLVMVTKETRLHNVKEALEAGADEYIMKPFTREVVRDKLQLLGLLV